MRKMEVKISVPRMSVIQERWQDDVYTEEDCRAQISGVTDSPGARKRKKKRNKKPKPRKISLFHKQMK